MPPGKLKILIFNWRDIQNPSSGGAEVLTHEMAKRWAKSGNEVTQLSSLFEGAKKEEVVEGVRIIRMGNPDVRLFFNSVHFLAFLYYRKYLKGKFDVVLDEIHGIPFFTPLYVKEKKAALICEVAGKIWDTNFRFPFNTLGKLVERIYFKFYKNIPFLTISPSTQKDLIDFGISKKNITVLSMGITIPDNLQTFKKEKDPTLIFVGRLLKAKGIEDAVKVCAQLKKKIPRIKLWIVGRGKKDHDKEIRQLAKNLDVEKQIMLLGFLSQQKKFEMMARAHILLVPSIKEGFGLTVPEAGIVGTPSVAYNVEGLRDVVRDGKSGFLVSHTVDAMANTAEQLLGKEDLYRKLQAGAIRYAKSLNWDDTAKVALQYLGGTETKQ